MQNKMEDSEARNKIIVLRKMRKWRWEKWTGYECIRNEKNEIDVNKK